MRKFGLHIIFVFLAFNLLAQRLHTHINKQEIAIGKPFTLTFSIVADKKWDTLYFHQQKEEFKAESGSKSKEQKINVIYKLEQIEPFHDTIFQKDKQWIWKGVYHLTGWDSAYVVIPPQTILINDSVYTFQQGLIHVTSPKVDPSKPIYDINEMFTKLPKSKGEWKKFFVNNWWWLLALCCVGIGIGLWLKSRKKKVIPLSLRQKTLLKIDQLEHGKSYTVNLKEYYFELSLILRRFLADHYGLSIMDKTTSEIQLLLNQKQLSNEMIKLIEKLLTQSDMVKFAQSKPPLQEIQNVTDDARRVVNEIADLDLQDE